MVTNSADGSLATAEQLLTWDMRLIPCYFLLYRRTYVDNIYTFVEVCRHIYLGNRYFWTGTLAGCMLYRPNQPLGIRWTWRADPLLDMVLISVIMRFSIAISETVVTLRSTSTWASYLRQ